MRHVNKFVRQYLDKGWHVLPLHQINPNGSCSCLNKDCRTPGKHPRLPNGVNGATNDISIAMHVFARLACNVGLACTPWQVYDIDPRNGGDETWTSFIAGHQMPETAIARTGGGGNHYLFHVPEGFRLKRPGKGVDIKGKGGYIVVAPSNHVSGQEYFWEGAYDPLDGQEIAMAPDWMLEPVQSAPTEIILPAGRQWLAIEQIADLRAALTHLDPDPYEAYRASPEAPEQPGWFAVLAALHSTGCPIARGLAEEWSMRSPKYTPQEFSKQWVRLRDSGNGTNKYRVESIFHWAKENGWHQTPILLAPPMPPEPFAGQAIGPITPNSPKKKAKQVKISDTPPPGILKVLVDDICNSAIRPQPRFAIQAALSLVATLFARQVATVTGLRTNLHLVSLGPTGCGKEHARAYIKMTLQSFGKAAQIAGETIASGQALLTRAAKTPNALFQIDEIGDFLAEVADGGHKGGLLVNFTKLYSSANSVICGTEYADQKINERANIEYPCCNLHATGTQDRFFDALKSRNVLDGAINRMLIAVSDAVPSRVVARLPANPPRVVGEWFEAASNWMKRQFGNLEGVNPTTPIIIPEDEAAKELFASFDQRIDQRMTALRSDGKGIDCVWSRAYENALKVALVCSLSASAVPVITGECARWAIEYVEGWTAHIADIVALRINDSEFGRLMGLVVEELGKADGNGMTRGVLFNRRRLREVPQVQRDQIIATLVENGEIIVKNYLASNGKCATQYCLPQYTQ